MLAATSNATRSRRSTAASTCSRCAGSSSPLEFDGRHTERFRLVGARQRREPRSATWTSRGSAHLRGRRAGLRWRRHRAIRARGGRTSQHTRDQHRPPDGAGGFGAQQQECFERLTALCGPRTALAPRVWTDMAAIFLPRTSAAGVARFADLVPKWGYDHLFWGNDSIAGALATARDRWPLGEAPCRTVANDRGTAFCA